MFDQIKKALQDAQTTRRRLTERRETLLREREDVAAMPPSREDVTAFLLARIEATGAGYPKLLAGALQPLARKPEKIADPQAVGVPGLGTVTRNDAIVSAAMVETSFVYLLAPLLADGVRRAVDAMPWPTETLPSAERVARLAKIDAEITKVEAELRELEDAAAAAGVVL